MATDGMTVVNGNFQRVGEVALDERKRISLAKVIDRAKKIVGDREVRFGIYVNEAGQFLLSPEVSVPAHEIWLLENPDAFARVQRGLKEAAAGDLQDLGSFAKFAEDDID